MRRARLTVVLVTLLAGAIGIIGSTQTWLVAVLDEPSSPQLNVDGAAAIPVLAPLSLATLALGLALTIAGTVLRYVFGALTILIAAALLAVTAPVAFAAPVGAVAATVTEATGIAGSDAVADLVASVGPTPWPLVTFAGWVLLAAAGLWTLLSARRWRRSGRRFTTGGAASAAAEGPLDAIDSWDDLSRGDDPTARR